MEPANESHNNVVEVGAVANEAADDPDVKDLAKAIVSNPSILSERTTEQLEELAHDLRRALNEHQAVLVYLELLHKNFIKARKAAEVERQQAIVDRAKAQYAEAVAVAAAAAADAAAVEDEAAEGREADVPMSEDIIKSGLDNAERR